MRVLKIPLSLSNILAIVVIVSLTLLGTVHLWLLSTRRTCRCPLCKNAYEIEENIGSGGFANVYLARRANEPERRLILKKMALEDITEIDRVQGEAKQLRRLQHRYIVGYEDEFVH